MLQINLSWPAFEVGADEGVAGELDGVIKGCVNGQPAIVFVEVKHCVRKNYMKAVSKLDNAKRLWMTLRDVDSTQLEGRAHQMYVMFALLMYIYHIWAHAKNGVLRGEGGEHRTRANSQKITQNIYQDLRD